MRPHTPLHLHDPAATTQSVHNPTGAGEHGASKPGAHADPAAREAALEAPTARAGSRNWRGAFRRGHHRLALSLAAGATVATVATLSSAAASTPLGAPQTPTSLLHRVWPHLRVLRVAPLAAGSEAAATLRPELAGLATSAARPARAGLPAVGSYRSWADAAMHLSLRRLEARPPRPAAGARARGGPALAARRQRAHELHAGPATISDGVAASTWLALRECESGDNYQADTGNGYFGAYQFAASTWWGIGYAGLPSQAPPAVQDNAARILLSRQGWQAWPVCAARLGLY